MPPDRVTFSLATLFRAQTLVCLAMGWLVLVRYARPMAVFFFVSVLAMGSLFAMMVIVRRSGPGPPRVTACLWILMNGIATAMYSATVASYSQDPRPDLIAEGDVLVLCLPMFLTNCYFMIRPWTRAARAEN